MQFTGAQAWRTTGRGNPPQSRRQGDGFNAVEFLQVTDSQIEQDNKNDLLAEMSKMVGLC